ncbi:MAG: cation-transporting P-type ATPase, partial [Deinococcales bacterium]
MSVTGVPRPDDAAGAAPAADGPPSPWARTAEEVLGALVEDPEHGLDEREAARRLERFGPNTLREAPRRSAWQVLVAQFRSLLVGLLAAAAVLSAAFG